MRANRKARWRAVIASVAMLASTTALALATASPAHADPGCQNGGVYILWARGSGQAIGDVEAIQYQQNVQNALDGAGVGTHAWAELGNLDGNNHIDPGEYPAVPVDWSSITGGYTTSVNTGADELVGSLNRRYALPPYGYNCTGETVVLGGYSQGADVIGAALARTSGYFLTPEARNHIGSVALYGDPKLNDLGCPRPQWVRGSVVCNSNGILGWRAPYVQADMLYRVASWCDQADGICNMGANLPGSHTTIYRNSLIQQSAAEVVATARIKMCALNPAYPGCANGYLGWDQGSNLYLLAGLSNGTFGFRGYTSGIAPATWQAAGNFNGSGQPQVASYDSATSTISEFQWNGSSWQWMGNTTGIGNPAFARAGDFNGDGRSDIAWGQGGTLYLLQGNTNGTFSSLGGTSGIGSATWMGAGNFKGGAQAELASYSSSTSTITEFQWSGSAWYVANSTTGIGNPDFAVTGDFNGDSRADIAWDQGGTLYVLQGNTNGTFSSLGGTSGIYSATWVGGGNFRGNGRAQVASYNSTGGVITEFEWNSGWTVVNSTSDIGNPAFAVAG